MPEGSQFPIQGPIFQYASFNILQGEAGYPESLHPTPYRSSDHILFHRCSAILVGPIFPLESLSDQPGLSYSPSACNDNEPVIILYRAPDQVDLIHPVVELRDVVSHVYTNSG